MCLENAETVEAQILAGPSEMGAHDYRVVAEDEAWTWGIDVLFMH
eukprot:SAG11_NODE_37734_length_255_cov_1.000000_1_plen_44_part_10